MNSFADSLKAKTNSILQESAQKIGDSALKAIEEVGSATVDAAEAVVQKTAQAAADATTIVANNAASTIKERAANQDYINHLSTVLPPSGGGKSPETDIENAEEITVIAKLKGGDTLTITTTKGFTLKKATKKGKKVLKVKKTKKAKKAKKSKKVLQKRISI